MSLPYPRPLIIDGDWTTATPVNIPEFESPIPGVAAEYMLKQRFRMSRNDYSTAGPLALNTAHPDYATFFLTSEDTRRDIGLGAMIEFTRTYCAVPATHYDWNKIQYSFIGLTRSFAGGGTQVRDRQSLDADLLLQFDYALCPSNGTGATWVDPIFGSYTVDKPGDIKDVLAMRYCAFAGNGTNVYGGVDLLVNILNLEGVVVPTWPSSQQYIGMIQDALTNRWTNFDNIALRPRAKVVLFPSPGTVGGIAHLAGAIDTANSIPTGADANGNAQYSGTAAGGIMPVKTSVTERWQGNIFRRTSFWALAQ